MAPTPPRGAARTASVLYLEDSDLDAEFVIERLTRSGLPVRVERVSDRPSFVASLQARRFDLVLSDYQVPTFKGLEVVKLVAELQPDVPLIYVSGAMGEDLAVEALKRGATDYVLKDHLARLVPAVERALAQARERRDAQAALQASEERFAFVRRSTGVGFWYCDLPLDVLEWDELVKAHFHLSPGDHITIQTFYDRLHPDDLAAVREAIERSITAREPYDIDFRTVHPATGALKWIRAIGRTSYSADGTPKQFDGISLDITDRKQAEHELIRLLTEKQEQDRHKDEFLATLAHELRNPLAPIRTGLTLLRLTERSPQAAEICSMMERQVGHMVRLIDDLLDVSRVTRGKLELKRREVDIQAVFAEALEVSRPFIEAGRHQLVVAVPAEPIVLDADPTRMAQVVGNLLNNAAKYTPDGGRIELAAERLGDEVVIRVRDDGMGIAPEMLTRIFEMFTQAGRLEERGQVGLGIGLALVSRLVELHGGTIKAESAGLGMGATFIVRLPIAVRKPDDEPALAGPRVIDAANRTMPGRVLVVDDNVDGAQALALLLKVTGHATRTAYDGAAALATARDFRPDVVILDIGMPGMNGYEVARKMRADSTLRNVVLVALTGWGAERDRQRAAEAGFDHHLTKPVDPTQVEGLLLEWKSRRRPPMASDTLPAP